MADCYINVQSTSATSATTSPLLLNETDLLRLQFLPTLADNQKEPCKSVSGKILFEKKPKNAPCFPSDVSYKSLKVSRGSVKVGDWMEISLSASETYELYIGLKSLYDLYGCMDGIPYGTATYARLDSGFKQFLDFVQNDPIRLTNPAMVTLTGKGRKARQVPLMKETCKLLDAYIRNFNLNSEPLTSPLFFNQKGQALSRYGITYILKKYVSQAELDSDTRKISPHVLRHTKAMHLLRAGVNMIYIRDFLGHVDISTTEVYARIDAEMKRKVFEEKVPNFTPNTTMPWEEDKDLLQWLTKFGKKSF